MKSARFCLKHFKLTVPRMNSSSNIRMGEVLHLMYNEKCPSEYSKQNDDKSSNKNLYSSKISQQPENFKDVKRKRSFTVAVEGNIGSGKSTLLNYFSKFSNVDTFQEPIDKWIEVNGNNLLQKLYEDPKRWSFLFQSYVQLTRLNIHLENSNSAVKLVERSFHNNRFCFVENDFISGNLSRQEYDVICAYYDFFAKNFYIDNDLIVYLRTSPKTVFKRMKNRGRAEEKNISLEYIEQVHKFYERWLISSKPEKSPSPILIINGDRDLDQVFDECEKQKHIILGLSPLNRT